MERSCITCGGTGYEEHIDPSLPPPPCRLCHPEEAQLHMALARDTRHVAATRRMAAYQTLYEAMKQPDLYEVTKQPDPLAL